MFELKESDLPELERLAARGQTWIARDEDGEVFAYRFKPRRCNAMWSVSGAFDQMEREQFACVHWSDHEPLNIAAAIAQIKAQKKPSGCIFCEGHENDHGFYIDGNALFYSEGKCGTEGIFISLCPKCGAPLPMPCEGGEKG